MNDQRIEFLAVYAAFLSKGMYINPAADSEITIYSPATDDYYDLAWTPSGVSPALLVDENDVLTTDIVAFSVMAISHGDTDGILEDAIENESYAEVFHPWIDEFKAIADSLQDETHPAEVSFVTVWSCWYDDDGNPTFTLVGVVDPDERGMVTTTPITAYQQGSAK